MVGNLKKKTEKKKGQVRNQVCMRLKTLVCLEFSSSSFYWLFLFYQGLDIICPFGARNSPFCSGGPEGW